MKLLKFALLVALAGMLFSCQKENRQEKTEKKKSSSESPRNDTAPTAAAEPTGCDPELWKRVYDPMRLEVLEQCKEVTGVIEGLDQNEDGDTHMLLKLDAEQGDLLKKENKKKKEGDLVVEVVCANPITDKKAKETCAGYSNSVHIPKVGDSVKVTGSYVIDSHNGWTEIHPASKIEPK